MGVYAGGSIVLGGYDPGRSDVDVVAVSRGPLGTETKREIGLALRHESLPCPARGLELVVYPASTVLSPTPDPGYELDLNTGREMTFRLSVDPADAPGRHWYVIDRAIVREHGLTLDGPAPGELFAPIPREMVLGGLRESIRWHETSEDVRLDDAVLNACRAWRYAAGGRWSSKLAAGAWARSRVDDPELIDEALTNRADDRRLDRERVEGFLSEVRNRVEAVS